MKRSIDQKKQKHKIPERRLLELDKLEKLQGFTFQNINLLNEALTHRSYRNESGEVTFDNERLEFLGDSVLAILVNEFLYLEFPLKSEGELSGIKSRIVSEPALARIAEKLSLMQYILLGKGEEDTGGRNRVSIKANLVEAILGALYLDGGLDKARDFILQHIRSLVKNVNKIESIKDYKTVLQEYCQKHLKTLPLYRLLEETGPDHERIFLVKVFVPGLGEETARGNSKRKAEQIAAGKILDKL